MTIMEQIKIRELQLNILKELHERGRLGDDEYEKHLLEMYKALSEAKEASLFFFFFF